MSFKGISHHMGKKHTAITVDQPLYSRGEELVLANSKCESVIFLMEGPYICFKFLKGIANTWTVQNWITYGLRKVNATKPTQTMPTNRDDRGDQITYKALWYFKWPIFKSWQSVG